MKLQQRIRSCRKEKNLAHKCLNLTIFFNLISKYLAHMHSAMVHTYMRYIPNWSVEETEYLLKPLV